jgi:hypothetical protein
VVVLWGFSVEPSDADMACAESRHRWRDKV